MKQQPPFQLFAMLILLLTTTTMCSSPTPQATAIPEPTREPTASSQATPTAINPTATQGQPAPTVVEPTHIPATASTQGGAQAVSFDTSDGATISAELYGSGDTAVIFSVMGDCKQGWGALAQAAAAHGFLALTYQWRGCKTDPNNQELLKKFVDDTHGAINFVRAQGVHKIILVGASLGGCASAALSNQADVIGLVVLAAPDAIEQWHFRINAADVAAPIPKLFIIADNDSVVPITAARALYDIAAEPKEWQTYPESAHGINLFSTASGPALHERILTFLTTSAAARS